MNFLYGGTFRTDLPEAYERLILDTMLGDATLFMRADEIEEQWSLVDAIVAFWRRDRRRSRTTRPHVGPSSAEELAQRDGRPGGRH